MKIIEERIRNSLLIASGVLLAALLTGRYVMGAIADYLHGSTRDFLLGAGFVALAVLGINAGQALVFNFQACRKIERQFPQNLDEVRRIGVQTPVDFAFMMGAQLTYLHYSPITPLPILQFFVSPKLLKRGRQMFAEMFGREPYQASTGNWDIIAHEEIAAFLHREGEDIPQEEFKANVSERVKRYYRKLDAES